MKSVYCKVIAQVFYDDEEVKALIAEAKANGQILPEPAAITSICTRTFDNVTAATIRDVLPDFSTIK